MGPVSVVGGILGLSIRSRRMSRNRGVGPGGLVSGKGGIICDS